MTLTAGLRKFTLTAHVTSSVGWLGAVVAYLGLAITVLTSTDIQMIRAAYLSMELIGWLVIIPFSLAAVFTGIVQSLTTEWGLFRHYWIATKFFLTVGAVTILLLHMPTVSRMADMAVETPLSNAGAVPLVLHALGGLVVLITTTTLSIFKPWGMTAYGRRKQQERRQASQEVPRPNGASSRWLYVAAIVAIVLFALFIIMHLQGGGLSVPLSMV
jgi:hypothetical protein